MKRLYEIPYIERIRGDEKQVVVIAHGFGSSMQSPTAQMMLEALAENGIGAIAFDFPGHGASKVTGDELSVENCVADLEFVSEYAAQKCPGAEIGYFGSSFGAYITLQYLLEKEKKSRENYNRGESLNEILGKPSTETSKTVRSKVFLRSAAVNMHVIFDNPTEAEQFALAQQGHLIINYGTPLKLTSKFIQDLKDHDLFEIFRQHSAMQSGAKDESDSAELFSTDVVMIHGTHDEDIDYNVAKNFADEFNIPLITVEGGDHRLSAEGMPEMVVAKAVEFFKG